MFLNKAYIDLGTNVGNWKNNFNQAIRHILKLGEITQFASIYISHPYGYKKQQYYYNSALELKTLLSPYFLLKELALVEKKLHKKILFKNGPRRIDLDIIFFNKLILNSNQINIPHIAAHQRDFVLLPIIEMIPFYIHPIKKKSLSSIYKGLQNKYVFKIMKHRKESLVIY